MIVSLVRFRSGLSDEEVEARFEARADGYRTLPGLVEKLYLRYRESGEFGAVYVWESEEALRSFRASELGRTIGDAYRTEGEPHVELADVRMVVRPRERRSAISS
jgi:heme-degrading monooxygenase HmoA